MDKKFIEREKTFNQKEYQKEYRQKMYKQLKFEVKHDFYEMFNNYCTDNGINKAELFRIAITEYIENHWYNSPIIKYNALCSRFNGIVV